MRTHHAFSFIEILITLSISIILLSLSLPLLNSFFSSTDSNLLKTALLNAIQTAQSATHSQHLPIALCQSNDSVTCGGNWSQGWLIFVNEKQDGVLHNPDELLISTAFKAIQGSVHWRSFPKNRNYLLFTPNLLQNENGTFWFCQRNDTYPQWAITINQSGRPRVTNNSEGVIKDDRGIPLKCTT